MSQFKINDVVYEVPEFTVAQDELFLEILGGIGMAGAIAGGEIDADALVTGLTKGRALRRFFALCLVKVNEKFNEDKLPEMEKIAATVPSSMIMPIVEEFIKKNRPWIEKLVKSLKALKEKYLETPTKATTPATMSGSSLNLQPETLAESEPSGI